MTEVRKEIVFTWMIEKFRYCLQKPKEELISPTFFLNDKSEWYLSLYPRGENDEDSISWYLNRKDKRSKSISLGYTFEIVKANGVALCSNTVDRFEFFQQVHNGTHKFELNQSIHEVNEFLSNNTFTLHCRIWKTEGNFPESRQYLVRTRVKTGTLTFLWCVKDFGAFSSTSQKIVNVLTPLKLSPKISFDLIKVANSCDEEFIGIEITVDNTTKQFLVCEFDLLDRRKKKVTSSRKEIWIDPAVDEKTWKVFYFVSKKMLTEKRALYLPDGSLNIQCRVIISSGAKTMSVVEWVNEFEAQNQQNVLNKSHCDIKQEAINIPSELKQDLLLMYKEGTLSDVTLETETENFHVHKALLCARCPVFHTMFTVDMKEKNTNIVRIDDLDADTVYQFLIYIYNESIENLDFESAKKLYFAGDKYEVFSLRKKCSDFILTKLTENIACEILLLADRHKDESFKDSVKDFILDHFEEVLELEEWKSFMKNNCELAAEVMYQKYSAG